MTTPERSSSSNRLPTLNQLAARINVNVPPSQSPNSANRPRLAAFALNARSSTSSLASTIDSVAVNVAASTRSTSPAGSVTTENGSIPPIVETNNGTDAPEPQSGDALTTESLKIHDTLTDKRERKVGYKNIPSLDAITARLAKTRALSIDGTAKPPDAEMVDDPKTPGIPMIKPEHPLQYHWNIYHDTKAPFGVPGSAAEPSFAAAAESEYEAGLTHVGEFATVESFCRYFNWLKPPSRLDKNANYHLFKAGIRPMWEDPANKNGGKWVLTMKNSPELLDRCWFDLCMALVGEQIETTSGEEDQGEICGAVVSLRSKVDRIQVWVRSKDNVGRVNDIGKKIVEVLGVGEQDSVGVEFQYNSEDRPPPGKFFGIQPQFSNYRGGGNTPGSTPTSGAFGSFGIGIGGSGGGGSAWRGKK
ncbi:translation initiation factor eIF4e [Cylindrobasidium torrendii FP15055 ss-10]|uniref:Translation initiation factor eIF4e n=1 Tax=Cylindrobasidium torrendii FP15055 ss-10 TaxID=1314674 RepID=A0A0D7B490_9AGAR|nr:translation initiation factor eIF4e [Cylindrobasidium torrendii FP15055 ss-10]